MTKRRTHKAAWWPGEDGGQGVACVSPRRTRRMGYAYPASNDWAEVTCRLCRRAGRRTGELARAKGLGAR